MLSVGIAQHSVPGFQLPEQCRGQVLDSPFAGLVSGPSPRRQIDGRGPTEKPGLRGEGSKRAEISNKFLSL
jgi:hypothetical protein